MQLPPEVKTEILRHVRTTNAYPKMDFKAIRLVNKERSACTSPFLFERIYWSPQGLDLEAFEGIYQSSRSGSLRQRACLRWQPVRPGFVQEEILIFTSSSRIFLAMLISRSRSAPVSIILQSIWV